MKKIIKYLPIFIPLLLGTLVGIIIPSNNYSIINKPRLSPPGIIFPIVWSILYLLMGISYFLVNKNKKNRNIFYLQLIINLLWSPIFFSFKLYFISTLWIILLIILVIDMINIFYKDNKISGYLNIFYLIWLIFAFYLCFGVYILN